MCQLQAASSDKLQPFCGRLRGERTPQKHSLPSGAAKGAAHPGPRPRPQVAPPPPRSPAAPASRARTLAGSRRPTLPGGCGPAPPPPARPLAARHAPCPRAARPPAGGGLTSRGPERGGRPVSARRPGPRPLGCGSAPTAGGGGALLGAGSSRRGGSPRGPGGEAGERGGGGERGSGRRGERGREGGPNPEREKRGEGEKQKGKKGPESAPRCGLRTTSPRPAWSSARPALLASLLPVCASPGRRTLPPRVPAAWRAPCPQGLRSPAGIFVCGARARPCN